MHKKHILSVLTMLVLSSLIFSCSQKFQQFGGVGIGNNSTSLSQNKNDILNSNSENSNIKSNEIIIDSLTHFGVTTKNQQIGMLYVKSNFIQRFKESKKHSDIKTQSIKTKISESLSKFRKRYNKLRDVRIGLYTAAIAGFIFLILITLASTPGSTLTSESGDGCLYVMAILVTGFLTIWGLLYALLHALFG